MWTTLRSNWNTARKKGAPSGSTYNPLYASANVDTKASSLWTTLRNSWNTARKKGAPSGSTYNPLYASAGISTNGSTLWKGVKDKWNASKGTLSASASVSSISVTAAAKKSLHNQLQANYKVKSSGGKITMEAYARGGIVKDPTVALIGEAGKEAVVPLEKHTEWMDIVADAVLARMGLKNITISSLALGKVLPANSSFMQTFSQSTSTGLTQSALEQTLENVLSRLMDQSQQPIYVQLNGKTIAEAVRYENNLRAKQLSY